MKINKLVYAGVLSTMIPMVANAVPVKYSQCTHKIKEVKGNAGYYFDENCTRVYVLPPRQGTMTVDGYNQTVVPSVCKAYHDTEEMHANFTSYLNSQSKLIKKYGEKIEELEEYIEDGLYPVGKTEEDLLLEIHELTKKMFEIREDIEKLDKDYVEDVQFYAQREGGIGTFAVENNYSDLIEEFRKANTKLNLSFERMPMEQSYLSVLNRVADGESNKVEMSAILGLAVHGIPQMPVLSGTGELILNQLPEGSSMKEMDIFGEALAGEIQLSAVGACRVKDAVGADDRFTFRDVAEYLSGSVTYQYQVQVERRHSITFKMRELIRKVHEQTKKGGFFSRKTINKMLDDRETDSWLVFHHSSQDLKFEYTEEYIREIKAEFLDRALRQVIAAKGDGLISELALIDPSGKNGADVIGDGLSKCPHLYCQIGSAGFKVLSAIFGSQSATSELIQKFDADISEVVVGRKMVALSGTTAFN